MIEVPAADEVLETVGKFDDAVVVVADHACGDAEDAVDREDVVGVEDECGLEVVGDGDDAGAVDPEAAGGCEAVEVDEDAADAAIHAELAGECEDVFAGFRVDFCFGEDGGECIYVDGAGDEFGVESVDKGVLFGVVSKEGFGRGRGLGADGEQGFHFVADLAADGTEASAQDVLEGWFEDEDIGLDAVECEFGFQAGAHLGGASGDKCEQGAAVGGGACEFFEEGDGAGDVDLFLGFLHGSADQVANGIKICAQVGFIQIPAIDVMNWCFVLLCHREYPGLRCKVGFKLGMFILFNKLCQCFGQPGAHAFGGDLEGIGECVLLGARMDQDHDVVDAEQGGAAVLFEVGELFELADSAGQQTQAEAPDDFFVVRGSCKFEGGFADAFEDLDGNVAGESLADDDIGQAAGDLVAFDAAVEVQAV